MPLSVIATLSEVAEGRKPSGEEAESKPSRHAGPDGSRRTATFDSAGADWDEERMQAALANLADFSMLRWEAKTVTAHRVVQEILRTRQDEPHANLTAALRSLNAALPAGNPSDVHTWPSWEPLRPHVAFAVAEGKLLKIAEPTSELMGYLGTLLSAKALYSEAETLERDALAIDEQQFGGDSTQVAVRLNNLAQTLQATNRLAEAEPLMRRALAIAVDFKRQTGHEHASYHGRVERYRDLLAAMNRSDEEITDRLRKITDE